MGKNTSMFDGDRSGLLTANNSGEVIVAFFAVVESVKDRVTNNPRGRDAEKVIVREMKLFKNKKDVIRFIAAVSESESYTINKIFSVNEFGVTTEQTVVFEGSLKLKSKISSGNDEEPEHEESEHELNDIGEYLF